MDAVKIANLEREVQALIRERDEWKALVDRLLVQNERIATALELITQELVRK